MTRAAPRIAAAPRPVERKIEDPVVFWSAQYEQAKIDAKKARKASPSTLDRMVRLERDAWEHLQAARLAAVPESERPKEEAIDTSLEAQLRTANRMRRAAESAGSHVAARQLLADEHAIAEKIRVRDEAAAAQDFAHLGEEALVDMVCQVAHTLPLPLRVRLRESLGGV